MSRVTVGSTVIAFAIVASAACTNQASTEPNSPKIQADVPYYSSTADLVKKADRIVVGTVERVDESSEAGQYDGDEPAENPRAGGETAIFFLRGDSSQSVMGGSQGLFRRVEGTSSYRSLASNRADLVVNSTGEVSSLVRELR